MSEFHVRIVTPQGTYKEWNTSILNIQTSDGDQGILANHMPIVTMLKIGKMTSDIDGKRETFAVAGGLFYFRDNLAEVMTDAIEKKEDINLERAEQSKQRAESRIGKNDPSIDLKRAELSLKKAMNRISIKNNG